MLTLKFTVTVPADTEALVITGKSEGFRSGVDVVRVVVGDSVVDSVGGGAVVVSRSRCWC